MSTSAKAIRVDELMQKAMQSLKAAKWFDAEQLAVRALQFAHGDADFERMALIVPALQEARRQRFQLALDAAKKTVKVLDGELGEEPVLAPGAYLLQPPLVGADARRDRFDGRFGGDPTCRGDAGPPMGRPGRDADGSRRARALCGRGPAEGDGVSHRRDAHGSAGVAVGEAQERRVHGCHG